MIKIITYLIDVFMGRRKKEIKEIEEVESGGFSFLKEETMEAIWAIVFIVIAINILIYYLFLLL